MSYDVDIDVSVSVELDEVLSNTSTSADRWLVEQLSQTYAEDMANNTNVEDHVNDMISEGKYDQQVAERAIEILGRVTEDPTLLMDGSPFTELSNQACEHAKKMDAAPTGLDNLTESELLAHIAKRFDIPSGVLFQGIRFIQTVMAINSTRDVA